MRLFLFILITFFSCCAFAQKDAYLETEEDSLSKAYIINLRKQIAEKNFTEAQVTLRKIFNLTTTIPDEVAFRYGEVQLGLNNYLRAEEAFLKYLSLTDHKGEFVKNCDSLLALTEKNICQKCHNSGYLNKVDSCLTCHGSGKNMVNCFYCAGKGKIICNRCGGQGVVMISSTMGPIYQACVSCNGKGIGTCPYCSGSCKREVFCNYCKGKGSFTKRISCDHAH